MSLPEPTDKPATPAVIYIHETHKEVVRIAPDGTEIGYQHYSDGTKILYYTEPESHEPRWTHILRPNGPYTQQFDFEFNSHFALCDTCRYHRTTESQELLCQEGRKLTAQYETEGFLNKYAELFRLGLII